MPDLQHFLIVYSIPSGEAKVMRFGRDYAAALRAYDETEEQYRDDMDTEVVLLGSDAYETLERTHSSYFHLSEHIDQAVARELAELGLR
jgi:hypothetical protein